MAYGFNPSVGDVIHVTITNINPNYGVFARMSNGRDGLIRFNDFSWVNPKQVIESFKEGDGLDVKVIYQHPDGKFKLSRKALLRNPSTIQEGTLLRTKVLSVEPFGIIVQLINDDITALVHKSELPRKDFIIGDIITCVVLKNNYDYVKRRNISGKDGDDENKELLVPISFQLKDAIKDSEANEDRNDA